MFQHYYQHVLTARPGIQHFACHSHHYWPDVTREAMLDYWDDTAKMADDKWEYIFSVKLPETQRLVAEVLGIKKPERIVFAPNTHELLSRIYSTFDPHKKIKVLTTDSEFYSFQRQAERWEQAGLIEVTRVSTEPFNDFETRFAQQAHEQDYDWIFCSQVFFNAGHAIQDLTAFVEQLPTQPLITIDGYHGFMALPTDLGSLEHQIFYLSGSYKYAQGGEGACFAVVPDGHFAPIYTGWFAEFGDLHQRVKGQVAYAKDGQQFAGATMDMSPMYRLNAVLKLFKQDHVTVESIHDYVLACQQAFMNIVDTLKHPYINREHIIETHFFDSITERTVQPLLSPADIYNNKHKKEPRHGHFLTFKMPIEQVADIATELSKHGIKTDYRGDRLRFGFAMYHEPHQYDLSCLKPTG